MPNTEKPNNDQPKNPNLADKSSAAKKSFSNYQSLGTTRDYLTVQMEQDASWQNYPYHA